VAAPAPARAYTAKKTKSPGTMLISDATSRFSLGVRPGAYHPISRHRMEIEPVVLNREDRSSTAMAVGGGRRLRRKQEARENKSQKRRAQNGRRMEVWIRMPDSTLCLSSPVSNNPSGVALGAHTTRVGEVVTQRRRNEMSRTSCMCGVLSVQESW
jgi:hypothetical protein